MTREPAPTFSFDSKDEMFAKKTVQVESWLYAIDVMSRETSIFEFSLERHYVPIDHRVAIADLCGPLAQGILISRPCWEVFTHKQKREQAVTGEERDVLRPEMSLAVFYRAMALDKPRLLLLLGQLKDQSNMPLLKLWAERHDQPIGVYTGST